MSAAASKVRLVGSFGYSKPLCHSDARSAEESALSGKHHRPVRKVWPGDWRTLSGGSANPSRGAVNRECHSPNPLSFRRAKRRGICSFWQSPPPSPKDLARILPHPSRGKYKPVSRRSAPGVSYSKPLVIPTREAQRNLLFPATTTAQSERSGPATSASRRKFVLRCFPHAVIYAPKPPPRIVIPKTRRCSAGREILRGSFLLSWLCGGWRTHSGGDKFGDKRNRLSRRHR
jgi:hypothetical protein